MKKSDVHACSRKVGECVKKSDVHACSHFIMNLQSITLVHGKEMICQFVPSNMGGPQVPIGKGISSKY